MSNYVVDPLSIATDGVLVGVDSINAPLRLAVLGFLVTVTEAIIDVPVLSSGGIGGPSKKFKKRKRFTAEVEIDGHTYTQTLDVDDLHLTVNDVSITLVRETPRPHLVLSVKGDRNAKR